MCISTMICIEIFLCVVVLIVLPITVLSLYEVNFDYLILIFDQCPLRNSIHPTTNIETNIHPWCVQLGTVFIPLKILKLISILDVCSWEQVWLGPWYNSTPCNPGNLNFKPWDPTDPTVSMGHGSLMWWWCKNRFCLYSYLLLRIFKD